MTRPAMPDAVAALPRDAVGRPVPWVSCWTHPSHDDGSTPPPVRSLYGDIEGCGCVVGEGTPLLGDLCPRRSVQGLLGRLCGTCGQPVAHDDDCWWPSTDDRPFFTEPPNHLACLVYALGICPHLVADARAGTQSLMRAYGYTLSLLYTGAPGAPGLVVPESASMAFHRQCAQGGPAHSVLCQPIDPVCTPTAQVLADLA